MIWTDEDRLAVKLLIVMAILTIASWVNGAEPPPVKGYVHAGMPPVVKGFVPATPVASGCGCTASANCGASFCKSHGGPGCPASCPVKANPSAAAPLQTYTLPSASAGGCANGSCSPGRTGWYPGRLLGR